MSEEKATVYDVYDGKAVALQLKVPYFGVTYPNSFIPMQEAPGFLMSNALRGTLRIKKDDVRIKFVLQTTDPDPTQPENKVFIEIDPDNVDYITVVEKSVIVSA